MATTTATTGSADYPLPAAAASVGQVFLDRVAASGSQEAFREPTASGGWRSWTWAETDTWVRTLAAGLLALGIQPQDRVAIASSTRLEWIHADLAVMLAGAATTTVYQSTQAEDVGFILSDSGSRIVIAEDDKQLDKLKSVRGELGAVEKVVMIDGVSEGDWVIDLQELSRLGEEHLKANPTAVDDAVAAVTSDQLATLIYTSGTTGRPKGVELTHGNWTYEGAAIQALDILRPDHIHFLWLPLAHSFGKVLLSAQLQIGLVTVVDGRVDRIVDNLGLIQPTVMAAAPRIFEKVYATVVSTTEAEGGVKAKIFSWAFDVGLKAVRLEAEGKPVPALLSAQRKVADTLVFSKIRARMGGRIEYFVSGSAALSREIAEWFNAAGLLILEGYGLTETSAATCVNRPGSFRIGTVGEPLPGTVIRVADDGELLVKGPGVMRGYHGLPEQTAEVFVDDGWFATGDIGEIDEGGRVRITDRKKDLVKTSGGKYIAPSAIEATFKSISPLVSQMVVYAEGRNYATALITIDFDSLTVWAKGKGLDSGDQQGLATGPDVRTELEGAIKELNSRLNRWETIKDFRVLARDLTIEDGELTPSLKVKRKVVTVRYAEILDSMYP